jgi:hypothetical protein
MVDTGKSINDLWKAGGFAVGFNATFNKRQQTEVGMGLPGQIVYDGSQYYWAIVKDTVAGYTVAYSTDLMTWTTVPTAPNIAGLDSFIEVIGSGPNATVVVGRQFTQYNGYHYFTTNMGLTWSNVGSMGSYAHNLIATGNPATPYVGITQNGTTASSTAQLYYLPSISASAVAVLISGITLATGQYTTGTAKLVNGIACFSSATGNNLTNPAAYNSNWVCCPVSADMTKAASYTTSANVGAQAVDITFFKNLWITAAYNGLYTAPNSGTSAAPLGPTAAWTKQIATVAPGVFSVDNNGSVCVAVGADTTTATVGAIYTSTDGVNWTKANRFILESSGGNNGVFTNVIWTGTQFVVTGGLNNNMVLTSPDGINWTPMYYPDYTEYSGTPASLLGVYSGTLVAGVNAGGASGAPGTYQPYAISSGYHVGVGLFAAAPVTAQSGTTRQVSVGFVTGAAAVALQTPVSTVNIAPLTHFYEIIATAIPGTTNAFTFQWAVDGVIVGTLPLTLVSGAFANAGDTGTAHLLLNLPRAGQWTVIDDIYVATLNGSNNIGQLGPVNILPWAPVSDAQANMTRNGNASSNAGQVAGPLSNSEGSVYSYTVGAQDIYKTSANIPAGYKIKGVQSEAYFTKYGTSGANCSTGIISGATEVDSAVVAANTVNPVYASLILETDPSTSAAWTPAGVQAAEMTVTKVN